MSEVEKDRGGRSEQRGRSFTVSEVGEEGKGRMWEKSARPTLGWVLSVFGVASGTLCGFPRQWETNARNSQLIYN